MRFHQPTIDYVARRTAEGLSNKDIIRCLNDGQSPRFARHDDERRRLRRRDGQLGPCCSAPWAEELDGELRRAARFDLVVNLGWNRL